MYAWFLVSMWLHLLTAMVWIGGLSFMSMVLVPVLRQPALRPQAAVLLRTAGRKFMRVAYASLVTLVVTGTANLYLKGGGSFAAFTADTAYGRVLMTKIALVVVVLALAVYHDFVVGPAAARAMESDPSGAAAQRLRARASWLGRVNMLLSLVIMTLALFLVRGLP